MEPNEHKGPPLRVAHVIHCLRLGGLEQLVVELADRGRERGVEPLLIALGEDGPVRQLLGERKIPIAWFGDLPGMSLTVLRKIGETLDGFGAQVAHAHDLGPWLNAVGAKALRPKTRVLATFHQLSPPTGPKRGAANLAARFSSALVACGNEVRDELKSWAPPTARVVTIGNGVPLPPPPSAQQRAEARARLGLPEGAVAVGYLGRMHEEKGPDLLLRAFLSRFKERQDVHLVLIGTGPLVPALKAQAAGAANVHLPGEQVGASALLPGLDVYAQFSLREGRSLSMLEAMAAGLPTVAHNLPAVAEIHSERTALLAPLGDQEALAGALARLVDDQGLRQQMGQAARKESRRYSIDAMVDSYIDLYREGAREVQA